MCETYHVVPWYNSKEWHKAYRLIYTELTNKQDALELLLMWKARCPSLPSGIESTLSLLQVCIQDDKQSDDVYDDQLLRLAYSSALMRFVNHMLDPETSKGSSLYQAAKNLGVPDWIVDLRHDTAHSNNLPSLVLLRSASSFSLNWLRKNYWDEYKDCVQDYISGQNDVYDEARIVGLINFYISLSICTCAKVKNCADIPDPVLRESIINDAKDLIGDNVDLANLKSVSITSLVKALNKECIKLLNNKESVSYMIKALLEEDSLLLSLDLVELLCKKSLTSSYKQLHPNYVKCFEIFLTFLHTHDLLQDLIMALINLTQSCDEFDKKTTLAALWISEILAALKKSDQFLNRVKRITGNELTSTKKKDLKMFYKHWFPNEKKNILTLDLIKPVPHQFKNIDFIQPIISMYNPYVTYYVKSFLNLVQPQLPISTIKNICKLANLIASPGKFPVSLSQQIFTVNDLKSDFTDSTPTIVQQLEAQKEDKTQSNKTKFGIWRKFSTKRNWSICPIGQLPPEQMETENIVVYNETIAE